MQKTKFYAALLVSVIFAGIFSLSPAFSSLMSGVVVGSTGQISTGAYAYARSGSPQDIQAAVDLVAAAGGGNVYVPEGDFVFNPSGSQGVLIHGGVNVFGAGKDKTILRQTVRVSQSSAMFFADGSNDLPTRISGFTFIGYIVDLATEGLGATGLSVYNSKNFRIDHCKFIDFDSAAIIAHVYSVASRPDGEYYWNWGLIDHCDFDNPYKDIIGGWWGYGISVHGPGRDNTWIYNLDDILGKWDIETNPIKSALYEWTGSQWNLLSPNGGKQFRWLVYIEDCTFSRMRHAVSSNGVPWYVVRHCNFSNPRQYPMVDVHGPLSAAGVGGRGLEAYDNTFTGSLSITSGYGFGIRGGGGVVINNTIIDCPVGIGLGMDYNIPAFNVHDIWIWGNTFQNVTTPFYNQNPQSYTQDVDYFLYAKAGYTPYPYPHPLTLAP